MVLLIQKRYKEILGDDGHQNCTSGSRVTNVLLSLTEWCVLCPVKKNLTNSPGVAVNKYFIITVCFFCHFIENGRYGPLRGPTFSSFGGLRPSAAAFFALWARKDSLLCCFGSFLTIFGAQ